MANFSKFSFIVFLCTSVISSVTAQESKEQNLVCAGYYFTLSFGVPNAVPDLTQKQATRAAFALLMKVYPDISSQEARDSLMNSWLTLAKEVDGKEPYTREALSKFRAKYDDACRTLLKPAWCEAYKNFSHNACSS